MMSSKKTKTNNQSNQENQPNNSAFSSFKKWFLRFTLIAIISFIALLAFAYVQFNNFINSPISSQKTVLHLHVESGSSVYRVAHQLHEKGYLSQPQWFAWYLRYLEKQHVIKAGEFVIQPFWNVDQLISALESGKAIQYPVTIIAGHTFKQTLTAIQALPKIEKKLDIQNISELQQHFNIEHSIDDRYPYAGLEGRFLPETYLYQMGDSDLEILKRAYAANKKVLQQAWENRAKDLPYKTPYEALIMASIVEKETGYAPERPVIAGVFVNRMRKGMRLQTDPTVIYGIGQSYDGNIRKRDLQKATPYNTYTINRLPPTPIALPSADAIEATLNPEKTKFLYFVAKGEGKHHFSRNLKEHNRAVYKYLLSK